MADSLADSVVQSTVITALSAHAGAAAASRTHRFDQLAADSAAMWGIAMTTPTVMAAQGIRAVNESGSGRTRAETNNPGNTAAPGGGQV